MYQCRIHRKSHPFRSYHIYPATPRLLPSIQLIAEIPDHDHSTFNITRPFDVPEEVMERPIQDPDPAMTMVVPCEMAYTVMEGATKRGWSTIKDSIIW